MSNELTPELQKEITSKADEYIKSSEHEGTEYGAYLNGATVYALKWQEAEQKIKELTQWKKEASWLLDPLLEWGQGRKDIPLGNDITKEILRRAKLFTEEEQKAEKALNQLKLHIISCRNHLINPDGLNMLRTIDEALTPKQATDDAE